MWDWGAAAGRNSSLAAPVVAGGEVVAALMFLACGDRPPYTDDDRALVVELAARVSAAVEHAGRFQRAREVSLLLQNSMLTEPPQPAEIGIGGLAVQARYLPAAAELQVGGDWYDAFRLPGGDLALAVGDVSGHDLAAAATMGSCAACCGRSPSTPRVHRRTCWPGSTGSRPGSGSRASRRSSTDGFSTTANAPGSAGRTPGIRRRCW